MASTTGLNAEVAVKILRRDLSPQSQAVQRLRDEGKMLAALDHPTILRVHDLTVLDGRVALVTEFVDGEDLGQCIQGSDPMTLRCLLEVVGSVASALDLAWNGPEDGPDPMRLVHRDIKPSNIRVSRHGAVKLLDFGIARSDVVEREAHTQTELMIGSPAYMAPERFLSPGAEPAADVFALGCTLYEGLVGQRLFADVPVLMMTGLAVDEDRFAALVGERFAKLPELPDGVLSFLKSLLAHEASERPTPEQVYRRCETLADEVGGRGLARWCRDRHWVSRTEQDGPLAGRTLTEGTLERAVVPLQWSTADTLDSLPPVAPLDRRRRWGWWLAVAGVSMLSLGLGLLAVLAAWQLGGSTDSDPLETPVEVATSEPAQPAAAQDAGTAAVAAAEPEEEAAPAEVPPPVPAAAPVPATAPARAQSEPDPVPDPEPEVDAAPPPAPEEPPAEASAAGEHPLVEVQGGRPVNLVAGSDRYSLPARVPPGSYDVIVFFPQSTEGVRIGDLTVTPGWSHRVSCAAKMPRCAIQCRSSSDGPFADCS